MAKRKKVEDYLADLNNADPKIKIRALKVLGKSGSVDSHIVSCIIPLLNDDMWKVRRWAARAFYYIGPQAEAAVPYLIKALDDKMATVRSEAALALGYIGEKSRPAIPMLKKALNDPKPSVRSDARTALDRISGKTELEEKLEAERLEPLLRQYEENLYEDRQKAIEIFEREAKRDPSIRKGKHHFTDNAFGRRVAAFIDGKFYRFFDIEDLGAYEGIPEFFTD